MYEEVAQSFRTCNTRSASPFCMLSGKQFTLLTRGNKSGLVSFLLSALFRETWPLGHCPAGHSLGSKTSVYALTDPLRQSPPSLQKILSDLCMDYGLHILLSGGFSRCTSGVVTASFNELIRKNQPTRRRQPGAHNRN